MSVPGQQPAQRQGSVTEDIGRGVIMLRKMLLWFLPQLGVFKRNFVFVRQREKNTPQFRQGHRQTSLGPPGSELACNEIWLCGVGLRACILVR
jgi:hypothetical protein